MFGQPVRQQVGEHPDKQLLLGLAHRHRLAGPQAQPAIVYGGTVAAAARTTSRTKAVPPPVRAAVHAVPLPPPCVLWLAGRDEDSIRVAIRRKTAGPGLSMVTA